MKRVVMGQVALTRSGLRIEMDGCYLDGLKNGVVVGIDESASDHVRFWLYCDPTSRYNFNKRLQSNRWIVNIASYVHPNIEARFSTMRFIGERRRDMLFWTVKRAHMLPPKVRG